MHPDDALHGYGEQPERIGLPQVFLRREGKIRKIVDPADVAHAETGLVELAAVERNRGMDPLDQGLEPLRLQGRKGFARQGFELVVPDHPSLLFTGRGREGRPRRNYRPASWGAMSARPARNAFAFTSMTLSGRRSRSALR